MKENFADLLAQSIGESELEIGAVVKGKVVAISSDAVLVSGPFKTDGVIAIEEFKNASGDVECDIGDIIDVVIEAFEDGYGSTRLSRDKARRVEAWSDLQKAYDKGDTIKGLVLERVKGGFTVAVQNIRAFLPGSLVDVRPIRDPGSLEGQELDFKIIKMDKRRGNINIVVSRRAVVEEQTGAEREALLENLEEGQEVKGVVKNITDYGAFVDLGGIDGLLHITDMSWKRIKHPSEVLHVGDEVDVKILKFDRDKKRVSLGIKQLGGDPWHDIASRYPVGSILTGEVTNIADYGCFVELEDGIEGLVHMSEMDWTNKNVHPAKVVQLGQEVEVKVLEIDQDRRRISLGIKQTQDNPWLKFAGEHEIGQMIKGPIKSITDFGIFVGLTGEIDGLIHLSDISWNETGEEAVRKYKKGDEVEAKILAMDSDRERISLGIKQLSSDPLSEYFEAREKNSMVSGKVIDVDAKRAIVELEENVQGSIRAGEVSNEQVKDVREFLNVGDEVNARLLGIDRKARILNLSLKEPRKKRDDEDQNSDMPSNTLGDLLKDKFDSSDAGEGDE